MPSAAIKNPSVRSRHRDDHRAGPGLRRAAGLQGAPRAVRVRAGALVAAAAGAGLHHGRRLGPVHANGAQRRRWALQEAVGHLAPARLPGKECVQGAAII